MIFVTISGLPFERLIRKMDRIAINLNEEVIMQIGKTDYIPKNTKYFSFTSNKKIEKLNKEANLIICHAGAGCIVKALKYHKPLIVVPRLKKFGEHINDHQLDLAMALEKKQIVRVVYDINRLYDTIQNTNNFKLLNKKRNREILIFLKRYLNDINSDSQ